MNDSFFFSKQFAAWSLLCAAVILGCYLYNNHLENQCLAHGGTVISHPDSFSACAFSHR